MAKLSDSSTAMPHTASYDGEDYEEVMSLASEDSFEQQEAARLMQAAMGNVRCALEAAKDAEDNTSEATTEDEATWEIEEQVEDNTSEATTEDEATWEIEEQ